jgi:hypothetical protein
LGKVESSTSIARRTRPTLAPTFRLALKRCEDALQMLKDAIGESALS